MARHFATAVRQFPFSRLMPEFALRVYDSERVEPPAFERYYQDANAIDTMLDDCRERAQPAAGYELEACWDLWRWNDGEWALRAVKILINCHGPEFQSEMGETFLLEFGGEETFLPQPHLPGNSLPMIQGNIRSLLKLVQDLESALRPVKRQLWSESGGNFAERLQAELLQTQGSQPS
jgi:hypothetical protein